MQRVVINVGDRIELTHVKSALRRKVSANTYTSQLLDYDGLRTAKISMPIYEGKIIPLELEDEFDLCFFTTAGLYRCRAKVTKRLREGNIHMARMIFLSLPKKYQRRQFYRLDCHMPVRYRVLSEEEKTLRDFLDTTVFEDPALMEAYERKLEEYQKGAREAVLTDISGGGIRFQCRQVVEPGNFVEVEIPLAMSDGTVSFRGMVKVVSQVNLPGESNSEERCEFDHIEKQEREMIVKFVFEEQKRRLRKESVGTYEKNSDN